MNDFVNESVGLISISGEDVNKNQFYLYLFIYLTILNITN